MCKDLADMRVKIAHMEEHVKDLRGDMQSLVDNTNVSLADINKKVDELIESISWFIEAVKASKWIYKTGKILAALGIAWLAVNQWAMSVWDWLLTHWRPH